ncbi:hypothetical protein WT81_33340 [Burkholderia stagnalis]|uniref:hypothetical protein n=1 Tax=Burkholderia stagnalis TaxID=1503054 RepID=UPI00076010D3|nr:hypothetical protein [Burkholderia stagnalis]KWK65181.1 hypothetical protein WT81_33340 [Burkholderia stagnalis]KWN76506.1 hypothetical protein WT90_00580 [Burkholderia stagnalis]
MPTLYSAFVDERFFEQYPRRRQFVGALNERPAFDPLTVRLVTPNVEAARSMLQLYPADDTLCS